MVRLRAIGRKRLLAALLILGGLALIALEVARGDQPAVKNIQTAISLIMGLLTILTWFGVPGKPPPPEPEPAERLAGEVRELWTRDCDAQRLCDPCPLPIRWRLGRPGLSDHPINVFGKQHEPLPDLQGGVDQLPGLLSRVIGHRVTVLGPSGSGKTATAILLVLRMLDIRARTSRSGTRSPVPVIADLANWNPKSTPFREWLTSRLIEDHPWLGNTTATGVTYAERLFADGMILPILDGFDEIPPTLRRKALSRLDDAGPLVMTSRLAEYAEAIASRRPLHGAAGIELCPLTAAMLNNYLPRTTDQAEWTPVLEAITAGDERLVEVFCTPLMISLARSVYSDTSADAADLLDKTRFPTAAAIEDRLLDALVPTAYEPDPPPSGPHWPPNMASRRLSALARRMTAHQQQDLAWWRLRDLCPRLIPGLAIACGLVNTVAWGTVYCLIEVPANLLAALIIGLLMGAIYGAPVGLGVWFLARPWPMRRFVGWASARSVAGALLAGAIAATVTTLTLPADGPIMVNLAAMVFGAEEVPQNAAAIQMVVAVLVGMLVFATFACEKRIPDTVEVTPTGLLRADRAWAIVRGMVCAIGLAILCFWFGFVADKWSEDLRDSIHNNVTIGPFLGPSDWASHAPEYLGRVLPWAILSACVLGAVLSSQWGAFTIVRLFLWIRGEAPWRFTRFLDDAYRRGVLRRSGTHYQFRHAELQRRLSECQNDRQ